MNKIKPIKEGNFIEERPLKEFQETGLIWFVNRTLHLFGWVIAYDVDKDTKEPIRLFVARTKWRGFETKLEQSGFKMLSQYLKDNSSELYKEANDE